MHRSSFRAAVALGFVSAALFATAQSGLDSAAGPADSKAKQSYAVAQKLLAKHDSPGALESFRKADAQDSGHCVACEREAYKLAGLVGDYKPSAKRLCN